MAGSTLLYNAGVITMDKARRQFLSGAVLVEGDTITAVGGSRELESAYLGRVDAALDLAGKWLLPGFVNTHVHTSQQLARGLADDVDLLTWLHHRIWPYEAALMPEDSLISTLLCGVELIRSGVTCFAEAGGQHVGSMAEGVGQLGLRAVLCASIMDTGEGLPAGWASETADSCIQKQRELYEKYHGASEGRVRCWFGLRQILNNSDELLLKTKAAADALHTGINMHVAEIPFENEHIVRTRGARHGTVSHLQKLGFLGPNLLAAHSVWLDNEEVGMFAEAGVKVAHCPAAAMHMLGFAPVQKMLEAGVCVALGTDGAPSNNRMSMVDEMYIAALVNKGKWAYEKGATDPTALPAQTILEMATINGAKAVLWDNEIGSLEPGKKADLIVVNPNDYAMLPLHDPVANMVHSMRGENVESVMCGGRWLMQDRKLLTVDEADILVRAKAAAASIVRRAGIKLPDRFNVVDKG